MSSFSKKPWVSLSGENKWDSFGWPQTRVFSILLATLVMAGCVTSEVSQVKPQPGQDASLGPPPPPGFGVLSDQQQKFADALAHFSRGWIYNSQGENGKTWKEWEEVIRLDPTRSELRERIAQKYFRDGDFAKAAEVLEMAVQQNPKSVTPLWMLAVAYHGEKQVDKAMENAEKAIRLDRDFFPPYHLLYDMALEGKAPQKAMKILDRANDQKSTACIFLLQLAEHYGDLKSKEPTLDIPKAKIERLYDQASTQAGDNLDVLSRVGDFYAESEESGKAIQIYKRILENHPNPSNIREKLALCYVISGDKESGVRELEEIVKREPLHEKIHQIYNLMGQLSEELKKFDRAITNYELSLAADPEQLTPHLSIALLQLHNKHPDEALKELAQANEKFPGNFQVHFFDALAYSDLKDYPHALDHFEEAQNLGLKTNPDLLDGVFYYYYGAALERGDQFEKAVAKFQKALELKPDYADAYNYLGFMYADKNVKLDEAEHLIEKALQYDPENGAFLDSMGWLYYREGKFDQALEYLQKAVKIIGNDAVVFDHLADVYLKMGNATEAIPLYEKAVQADPDNKEAREKLKNARHSPSDTPKPISVPAPPPTGPLSQ